MKEYVSVDVETTGLAPKQDKIIEIGAVRVRDGQIVGHPYNLAILLSVPVIIKYDCNKHTLHHYKK